MLALLVIVAHGAELLDGNRSRELLTMIFGTITFGEFAVDGFFIISGYLITSSYLNSSSLRKYFANRVKRIYPGFLAATLLCVVFVAPLGGINPSTFSVGNWISIAQHALRLDPPQVGNVFEGQPHAALNAALWTIKYEFECYLLVPIVGYLGLFKRKWILLTVAASLMVLHMVVQSGLLAPLLEPLQRSGMVLAVIGNPAHLIRFVMFFACGSCFRVFREDYRLSARGAAVSAALLLPAMFSHLLAEPAMAVFGAYVIFWIAFNMKARWFIRLNQPHDISYGVYLYAWPATMLIVRFVPDPPVVLVILLTATAAILMGALSWFLVEKPATKLEFDRNW